MHPSAVLPLRPVPPAWVFDLFPESDAAEREIAGLRGMALVSRRATRFSLVSGTIAGAVSLPAAALRDEVARLYGDLLHEVHRQQRHCVRVWNFVPDIHAPLGDENRYMTFNAGRFAAYCEWFGGAGRFPGALPTASAGGAHGEALSIHMLAADDPGLGLENPRQIPAYQYSRRCGRRPPCFSRATRLGATVLIGGTASILGQQSEHQGDLDEQARETFRNIEALIGAASRSRPEGLDALRSLRVHVRHADDTAGIERAVDRLAPGVPVVEYVEACLCRRELLVEIEGVAVLAS